ncbi:hypothetical protein QNI19_27195 [Cytophagaceae bacterium DM2B3-1]|uniref:Uncharacterized protein n=1 Tax=Xanthocytophaga flava TaxID=3048013 RepID=A0ABT7CSD3_9BACT|nr:hypothetical protein [Xanthocytophaga flavus]MDJ1496649.1 hypothetical protein [Xanthocytophaga flavus]
MLNMRERLIYKVIYLSLIGVTISSVSFSQNRSGVRSADYCAPALSYIYDTLYFPKANIDLILNQDTSLVRRFSRHDLLVANAVGIIPLLQQWIRAKKNATTDTRLGQTIIQSKIQSRLHLASTEIASLAAELDCAGEHADQLATYLDQKDEKRIRKLTILSIVIGAVTTGATALVDNEQTNKVVGIGGGLISAVLGGMAAFSSHKTLFVEHKRNLLTDIWNENHNHNSSIYSPFVWYMLNEKSFSNTAQLSVIQNIRKRWQAYALNGMNSREVTLYFGPGGEYQQDDLHTRANMLNQLQSSVRSINQDLQSLMLALSGW